MGAFPFLLKNDFISLGPKWIFFLVLMQVFADMEELGVRPDEDTVRRIASAFQRVGQDDKQKLVLKKYRSKWKYIHFKGERVRVRRDAWYESGSTN